MIARHDRVTMLIATILTFFAFADAAAVVIHVPVDQPTIQAGLDAAATGDTVLVAAGTYSGAGNHDLRFSGRDIVLLSEGGAANTVIDCAMQGRAMVFDQGETAAAIVEGFTIANAFVDAPGGAIVCQLSNPTIIACAFVDNSADTGGGLWLKSASPSISDCSFSGNFAGGNSQYAGRGGAIFCADWSSPIVAGCTFDENAALRGGALWCSGVSSPTLTDCSFTGNVASSLGGAIVIYGASSSPTFTDCQFTGNSASSAGGAAMAIDSSPTFESCSFTVNATDQRGGAFFGNGAAPLFNGCVFAGNSAIEGGAVSALDSSPTLIHCTLHGNEASLGGGLYVWGATVTVEAVLENTIIAFGVAGEAVTCGIGATATLSCCDVFANAGGDWTGCLAGQLGVDGNISEDPLFCDAAAGDFRIETGSPCAPPQSGACGLIGALEAGCGTTATGPATAPAAPAALRAYPMPFRAGAGTIEWTSEEPAAITLKLYDALGRMILTRDLGMSGVGTQRLAWRDVVAGASIASGVYFVELDGLGHATPPLRIVWTR